MTRIFKPDPVMVQKDRVRAALRAWQETRRAVNDPDAVPQRLDAIIKVVWTVTETIGPEIVTHIDAVVVELEGLPFPVEGDDPLRGLENATLALQGALGTLKRAAMNVGYEAPESEDLPRIPRAVVVDELEGIKSRLDTLSLEIKQIKLQQADEQENDSPPGQAPIVNNVVEKVELNIEIMSVKIDGQLIDVEALSTLTGNVASLLVSFADAVSQLGPRVSKWLVKSAKEKFSSTAIAFVDLGRGLVTKAQTWIKGRRAVGGEAYSSSEHELAASKAAANPNTLPDDFDLNKVREYILAGREPKPEWRPWVTELDLGRTELSNLAPLRNLVNLQMLNLTLTNVSDIRPLQELVNLRKLYLMMTPIAEIEPLQKLINLQVLNLSHTLVADVEPLKNLYNLNRLLLTRTQVVNLDPLKKLFNLNTLYLNIGSFTDVDALSNLFDIQYLYLRGSLISNVTPLKSLLNLEHLDLSLTSVADIGPLKQLVKLRRLQLGNTQVTNVKPLNQLVNLQTLDLSKTPITNIEPVEQLANLKTLDIEATNIDDLSPLKNLKQLEHIYVEQDRISRLARSLGREGIVKVRSHV